MNLHHSGYVLMRIILADHHAQARWALKTMLEEQPELNLVGEAVNAQDLLMVANEHSADLFLVDKELPGCPTEDLIASLHTLLPRPIVIVMSSKIECSRVSLKAGADAFVSKEDQPDWLLEILYTYVKRMKNGGTSE
jgi:two-component system, NarL family, nitrate/nitrite response regulator NarL